MIKSFIKGALYMIIGSLILMLIMYGAMVSFFYSLTTGSSWIFITYAFSVFAVFGGMCGVADFVERKNARKRFLRK